MRARPPGGLTRREADIFVCITHTVVAPGPGMPPVAETDASRSFAALLGRVPPLHRNGLRALLYAVEVGPVLAGYGARLRRLDADRRAAFIRRIFAGPAGPLVDALRGLAHLSYYGDDSVAAGLGYDPEANLARGRALRREEARW